MSTKEVQVRRRDAYNRVGLTVEKNPATDNVRISREVPAPERIADNHHVRRTTLLFRSREPAPQVRLDTEPLKETRRDAHSPNSLRADRARRTVPTRPGSPGPSRFRVFCSGVYTPSIDSIDATSWRQRKMWIPRTPSSVPFGSTVLIDTSRSASGYGKGLRRIAFTKLKMVRLPPIPTAIDPIAARAKPG